MCLIIAKPAGVAIPREWIVNAANNNDDSVGVAYYDDTGTQKIHKWLLPNNTRVARIADLLDTLVSRPVLVHFRLTTHGKTNELNCHPFPLGSGAVIAHNGIISGANCPKNIRSDTKVYIDEVIKPWIRVIGLKEFLANLQDVCGDDIGMSKLCAMDKDGNFYFANEKMGTWEDGMWLSNEYSISSDPYGCCGGWYNKGGYSFNYTKTRASSHRRSEPDAGGWVYDNDLRMWVNDFTGEHWSPEDGAGDYEGEAVVKALPARASEPSPEPMMPSTMYDNALEWELCPECGGPLSLSLAHKPARKDYCEDCKLTVFKCGVIGGPRIPPREAAKIGLVKEVVSYDEKEFESWASARA